MKKYFPVIIIGILFIVLSSGLPVFAGKEKGAEKKEFPQKQTVQIPNSVITITKENTYPNPAQNLPKLQPSELTAELLKTSKEKIENPDLIKMLNETSVNSTPFAFGYRAVIYLGRWPLNYQSSETSPNWEYQKINTNFFDNRGGNANYQIHYVQEQQKVVRGGLTAKIPKAEQVKKMMLMAASEKTNLPLAFETIVGAGTKNRPDLQHSAETPWLFVRLCTGRKRKRKSNVRRSIFDAERKQKATHCEKCDDAGNRSVDSHSGSCLLRLHGSGTSPVSGAHVSVRRL